MCVPHFVLKESIEAVARSNDTSAMAGIVEQLEQDNPTSRPAASPLLDGVWETVWVSEAPRWTRTSGCTLFHEIDLSQPVASPGLYRWWVRMSRYNLLQRQVVGRASALGGDDLRVEVDRMQAHADLASALLLA